MTPSASSSEVAVAVARGTEEGQTTDLVTPAPTTRTGSMDSDDDFMSDVSSQEGFLDMQGSEDESIGEGE